MIIHKDADYFVSSIEYLLYLSIILSFLCAYWMLTNDTVFSNWGYGGEWSLQSEEIIYV